jgi:hypothetical protein
VGIAGFFVFLFSGDTRVINGAKLYAGSVPCKRKSALLLPAFFYYVTAFFPVENRLPDPSKIPENG